MQWCPTNPPLQSQSVGPKIPGHISLFISGAGGTPRNSKQEQTPKEGKEEAREGERKAGRVPGLPGILCYAHFSQFAHSLWTTDLDCFYFSVAIPGGSFLVFVTNFLLSWAMLSVKSAPVSSFLLPNYFWKPFAQFNHPLLV